MRILVSTAFVVLACSTASAESVTLRFTGEVDGTPSLTTGTFGNAVDGDPAELLFTYESSTSPVMGGGGPGSSFGLYDGAVSSLTLTVGAQVFDSQAPASNHFRIQIQATLPDQFTIGTNVPLSDFRLSCNAANLEGDSFADGALPTTLDPSKFELQSAPSQWRIFNTDFTQFIEITITNFEVVGGEPIDTDGDGLDDATEIEIADGGDCPDPLNPDSDGDGISDGDEALGGTSPCSSDSDEDGVPDGIDPFPTDPGGTSGYIEDELRDLGTFIDGLGLDKFEGNDNRSKGRRNALSNKANSAANKVASGSYGAAINYLESLLGKVDGEPSPSDWMADGPEKTDIADQIEDLIELLEFLL